MEVIIRRGKVVANTRVGRGKIAVDIVDGR